MKGTVITSQRQPRWLLGMLSSERNATDMRVIHEIHSRYRYTILLLVTSLLPVVLVLFGYILFSSGFPIAPTCYPHTDTYNADFLFHMALIAGAVFPTMSLLARAWWVSHFFASDEPILTSSKLDEYNTRKWWAWTYPPVYNTLVFATAFLFLVALVVLSVVIVQDTWSTPCPLAYRHGVYTTLALAFPATAYFIFVHESYARKWFHSACHLHSRNAACVVDNDDHTIAVTKQWPMMEKIKTLG